MRKFAARWNPLAFPCDRKTSSFVCFTVPARSFFYFFVCLVDLLCSINMPHLDALRTDIHKSAWHFLPLVALPQLVCFALLFSPVGPFRSDVESFLLGLLWMSMKCLWLLFSYFFESFIQFMMKTSLEINVVEVIGRITKNFLRICGAFVALILPESLIQILNFQGKAFPTRKCCW